MNVSDRVGPIESMWPQALYRVWMAGAHPGGDSHELARALGLDGAVAAHLRAVYEPLAARLADRVSAGPRVLGINGAQGTGKSTAARVLEWLLAERGYRVCRLSIDDFYLPRDERRTLARDVHPLLATRGVPGTHDWRLGRRLLDRLLEADETTRLELPRFDKARDDRAGPEPWRGRADLIVLEGWCVGARPQPVDALAEPVNGLERSEDPDGRWRAFVNRSLSDYQALFARLDALVMLRAPSFEQVLQWRGEQEATLARRLRADGRSPAGLMDGAALRRFIQLYERLTHWMLKEMPARADLLLSLNPEHRVHAIHCPEDSRL